MIKEILSNEQGAKLKHYYVIIFLTRALDNVEDENLNF